MEKEKMASCAIQNGFSGEKMAEAEGQISPGFFSTEKKAGKNEVLKSIPFSIVTGAFTQNSNFLGELEWL